jgi:hypothetical protein
VAVDAVAAPSETAAAPIAADPRHGDAAMISRDQLPRNGRLKIGILLGLAAVAMGICGFRHVPATHSDLIPATDSDRVPATHSDPVPATYSDRDPATLLVEVPVSDQG